jgi:hypothetical protein
MSRLTPDQQREWAEDVSHAEELAERGHNGAEVLWGETTLAVNARLVALERVAEAARNYVAGDCHYHLTGRSDRDMVPVVAEMAAALAALDNKEAK